MRTASNAVRLFFAFGAGAKLPTPAGCAAGLYPYACGASGGPPAYAVAAAGGTGGGPETEAGATGGGVIPVGGNPTLAALEPGTPRTDGITDGDGAGWVPATGCGPGTGCVPDSGYGPGTLLGTPPGARGGCEIGGASPPLWGAVNGAPSCVI